MASSTMQDPPAPPVVFTDSESMLQHGTHVLHEQLAAHLEVALGKPLPQMEVRFKHVSITAEVVVTEDQQSKNELPTLVNTVKKAFMGLSAKKRVVHKEILHDVSGTFKPGTITLVLGQPGSGKSSLMKLLTGRFPRSKNVDVQGEMTYNGTPQSELTKQLPQFVSYVTQRDNHFPTLTVKETLEFAHHCCGGELPAEAIRYHDAQALMVAGTEAMHDHVASTVEVALGKPMPRMEIRVHNLSISADHEFTDAGERSHKAQLPTITNELRKATQRLVAKKRTVRQNLLSNVNALFRPGTMTLVLGQPGSGKSVLMKTLSGLFKPSKTVRVSGDVTYNSATAESLGARLPQFVSYVTQRDKHFPMLSVRETLDFAHACCGKELPPVAEEFLRHGTPEENLEALEAARALYRHMSGVIIQQLGLSHCQDTPLGDEMTRGVSGGERKRVTTGEMHFGLKFVLCMDEITTGLDSAASFDILRMHRSLARKLRMTMVISLLQPTPEILALFDDILLLNEGHVMYYGPCARVESYFQELGFERPPRRDVADFLLDLGTDQQSRYEKALANQPVPPRTPAEFGEAFERSALHATTMEALATPVDPVMEADVAEMIQHIPMFFQSLTASTALLMRRQFKITARNKAMLIGRTVMVVVMGLLYASVFFKMNAYNSQVVLGVIFTAITPQKYTLAILSAIVFSDCPGPESNDLGCRQLKNAPLEVGNVTVKAYVERVFEMKHKNIWTNFAVIVGMIVLFRLLALLSLRFINHQRR
ncbi:TPA: hypothetical protein N0F65_005582 [Lagenidium giganteum]|uniref:ABC transporter domain-containing protein n=1 Tax=Lagenidium giganteum TaxID=4803 RepID=A0AAV2Z3E8_9STRA|nr:TPA: hypothetical protein N0F65_005582 [Lagenidium giganteum]